MPCVERFRVGAPAVPVAHRVRWRETAALGRLPGSPTAGSTGSGFEAVALCGTVFVLVLQLCQWHIECAGGRQRRWGVCRAVRLPAAPVWWLRPLPCCGTVFALCSSWFPAVSIGCRHRGDLVIEDGQLSFVGDNGCVIAKAASLYVVVACFAAIGATPLFADSQQRRWGAGSPIAGSTWMLLGGSRCTALNGFRAVSLVVPVAH